MSSLVIFHSSNFSADLRIRNIDDFVLDMQDMKSVAFTLNPIPAIYSPIIFRITWLNMEYAEANCVYEEN